MEAYLVSSSEKIPTRKHIKRIIVKERRQEKKTSQILLHYFPAGYSS